MVSTRAAVLYQAHAPLVIEQAELNGPGPGEVLVRLRACGVCHSDLHILKGEWQGFAPPIVVGHEVSGIVEQLGAGVDGFAADRRELFNDSTNIYNIRLQQLPDVIVARLFSFTRRNLWEIDPAHRADVDIKFEHA